MSRVKLNVFDVTKVEVSKINEIDGVDGVFYTAYIRITSTQRCYGIKPSEVSKEKLKDEYQSTEYQSRLSGDVTDDTSICLYANTKQALSFKLNAFKS